MCGWACSPVVNAPREELSRRGFEPPPRIWSQKKTAHWVTVTGGWPGDKDLNKNTADWQDMFY